MNTASIHHLFHNCLAVKEQDGEFFPVRFSDSLLSFYDSLGESASIRAHCCAGITMDFFTSADEISFRYRAKSFCRPMMVFDFFEDGSFLTSIREPDNSPEGILTYRKTKPGRIRITIHLPYCAHLTFSDFYIPDFEPTQGSKAKILFLGDSITQGMTALHPCQTYTSLLTAFFHAEAINQGVGGYVYDKHSLKDIPFLHPDRVFVAYGTNDYSRLKDEKYLTKPVFSRNVHEYMESLHALCGKIPVTVITPLWRSDCMDAKYSPLFGYVSSVITETAQKEGFTVIQGLSLVGHMEAFFVDGLHPNDHGAALMANGIKRQLKS